MTRLSLAALAAILVLPCPASSQSLARRVADLRDGSLQFTFAAHDGVCGDGATYIRDGLGDDSRIYEGGNYSGRSRGEDWPPCIPGPVRVVATIAGGELIRLHTFVGPSRRDGVADRRDLGPVGVDDAASWLTGIIEQARGRVAGDAILPLILADSITPWPTLLRFARDERLPRSIRGSVNFWLARGAAAKLGLNGRDEDPDDDVRGSAVFALSQQPKDVAVPQLIELARHSRHPGARAQALFWLGQSGDPRAADVFEEILGRR